MREQYLKNHNLFFRVTSAGQTLSLYTEVQNTAKGNEADMNKNTYHLRIKFAAFIAAILLIAAAPVAGSVYGSAAETSLKKAPRQEIQVRYLQPDDIQPSKMVRQITSGNNIQMFLKETAQ